MTISPAKKKIIFLIDSLEMGGAERLLTIYLQFLDKDYFDARVCVLQNRNGNPMATQIRQMGIPVDDVAVPRLVSLAGWLRLWRYLKESNADLLHTQLEFADTMGGVIGKLLSIPTFNTLHTFDAPKKGSRTFWRLWLRWAIMRHFFTRVIAVSEGTRQHHIRMGKLPPKKVITLYNGIDLSRFSPLSPVEKSGKRVALNIPADAKILITVAVLRPPKGIRYLINALPTILDTVPNTYYLLVGDGENRTVLEDLAQQNKVTEHVVFAGTRDDIPQLLAISDIFVLPTLTEALPTVLAEAMAAQKPIIASKVGGVPEMLEDGQNGILVPPADEDALAQACIKLLENPIQAETMGRTGYKIVYRKFNIQQQVIHLENLYRQFMPEPKDS